MARRRMIDPTIWDDEHFGKLSDRAKVLFIACISNADDDGRLSGNPSHLRALSFRFNDISIKEISSLKSEIQSTLQNFICYSVNGCEYIQFAKWTEYQNIREDRRKPSKYPDVNQASTKCQPNDRLDKISIDKTKGAGAPILKTVFKPPTIEEVRSYCKERDNSIDPVAFVSHYETVDWMRGKNKIKNWKACITTWEQREPKQEEKHGLPPLKPLG